MKLKSLIILLIAIVACNNLKAQCNTPPTCILNSGMDFGTGNPQNGTSIGTSLPNWTVFNGNPVYATGMPTSFGIQLNNSDGVFACYNFQIGRKYRICFYGRTPNNVTGNILIEASDGTTSVPITNSGFFSTTFALTTFTFTATNNYTQLRFSVPNTNNSSYAVVIDDVGVIEIPTLTVTPSVSNGCNPVTIQANSSTALNYTWSPANTLDQSTGPTVRANPCQTTTYTVNYTSSCSQFSCTDGNEYVTVTVNPNFNVSATPSTILGCGSSTLSATSSSSMSVSWSPSIGLSSTSGSQVIANPCKTTTYTATFFCQRNNCSTTRSVTVFVQKNGTIVNKTGTPCGSAIDLEYAFTTPCPGATFQWYKSTNPTAILSTTSKYIKSVSDKNDQGAYYVIVSMPNKCKDTFYTSVVMDCCKLFVDFDIVDCNPVRFVNKTLDDVGGNPVIIGEWHWDFGDGTTSNIRNPSHLYRNIYGTQNVCLTAVVEQDNSTCCAKVCKDVTLCDFACDPKAAFDYELLTPGTTDVKFTDKSVGAGIPINYEWKVNGVVIPSANGLSNPTITLGPWLPPGPAKKYIICMKVTYSSNSTSSCYEEWCEEIEIP